MNTITNHLTCETCKKAMKETGKAGTGECRANPPTVQLVMVPKSPLSPQPVLAAQRFFAPVDLKHDYCWQHSEVSVGLIRQN